MKAAVLASVLAVVATAAWAQSFQTALPVSPAERRAIEARLSTILEFAEPDEVNRFELPSGRTVIVRPYRTVRRPGRTPCRGYRVDLYGRESRTAVDGFRCKRNDGQAWAIVEPELILAQEGPRVIPTDDAPFPGGNDAAVEPLYADEDFADARPSEPPPVPRPSPWRTAGLSPSAAANTAEPPLTDAPLTDAETATREDPEFAARVNDLLNGPQQNDAIESVLREAPLSPAEPESEPLEREVARAPVEALPDAPQPPQEEPARVELPAEDPAPQEEPRESVRPAQLPAEQPVREVAVARDVTPTTTEVPEVDPVAPAPVEPEEPDFSQNADVVAALHDLDYLPSGRSATKDAVDGAIDAFAIDERFALPISEEALLQRLDEAIERSETLGPCGPGATRLCLDDGGSAGEG